MLTWICVCPPDMPVTKTGVICSVTIILANLSGLAASVAYFHKYLSIDLSNSLNAVLQIVGNINYDYAFLSMFLQRNKIMDLLSKLSVIYKQRKFNFSGVYI